MSKLAVLARAAAIAATVVIVAVLSLYALRVERPGPSPDALPRSTAAASPTLLTATPTATVTSTATPATAASPSPTAAAATDRYGYVFTMEDRIIVRREREATQVFELAGVSPAVSPDGKRLAYWRTTPDVGATDLRVLDVTDPRTDRSVLTLTGQTLGGGVVWSNDGQGLLVVTQSREMLGHCFAQSSVVMLDLATTPPAMRSATEQGSSACVYLPLAWDRPGQFAAAVTTGPGGAATEYVTWKGNAADPFARAGIPPEVLAQDVKASADAKLVLGLDRTANTLRVWPILDITQAGEVRHPLRIASAFWRPGATSPYEVIWTVGFRIDLFRYRTSFSTTLHTSTTDVGVVAVRPDGSGVFVREVSGQPPPTSRWTVVDIATRQATDVAAGGLHFVSRGVLLR